MNYLIALTLPHAHENKRDRILAATLSQLADDAAPVALFEESALRMGRTDTATDVFGLLKVQVRGEIELKSAAEAAAAAARAGNSKLRLLGLPSNIQVNVFVQPATPAPPGDGGEQ